MGKVKRRNLWWVLNVLALFHIGLSIVELRYHSKE
jgi:hypothetical protein